MSKPNASSPIRRQTLRRFWIPGVVLALGVLAVLILGSWPSEEWDGAMRHSFMLMASMLTGLVLLLWFLLLSGFRWWYRVGGLLLLFAGVYGFFSTVRDWRFSGDMIPSFRLRWQKTADEELEAHWQAHKARDVARVEDWADRRTDYLEYRGPMRDGVVSGPPLNRDWSARPPRRLWEHRIGGGYAGFVVSGNAAVTIEQRRDEEAVACYDTATGQQRWIQAYPAHFIEALGGPGPRATPTIRDGAVYSLGATGRLLCLELTSGQVKWSHNILEDNDNVAWGMSGSPLVFDNAVVVSPGTQRSSAEGRALVAYDRLTGRELWRSGNTRAGYSSPMLATLAGQRQIVLFDGEELGGYDAQSGTKLWRFPWVTQQGINVAQPLVLEGDRLFVSSGYGVGCALLQIGESSGRWSARQIWHTKNLRCKFTSPILYQGFIYGLDDGILVCLDPETGGRKWKGGRYGHGQMLRCEDLIVILSETGKLVLVEATPEDHRELGVISALHGKTWNYPALADGKAYVRNDGEMACFDLTARDDQR
jgi:outer membrane protein assembly factor BamB